MAMDFFERQDMARANSRKSVLLFLLALPCVIAAVYLLSVSVYALTWAFLAFWRSVFLEMHSAPAEATVVFVGFWHPKLLLGVGAATLLVVVSGSLYKSRQLAAGGRVVAVLLGGERLSPETKKIEEVRLLHVVEEMSVASGTAMLDIYILRGESGLNAFVAGNTASDAILCATDGCLRNLTRDELQGVVAHEYSHILNGDMRLNMRLMGLVHGLFTITLLSYWVMGRTYRESERDIGGAAEARTGVTVFVDLAVLAIGFLLAFIGWNGAFFGRIIKGAASRQREFLADAAAVQFTRYPEGLANALNKVMKSPEGSIIHSPRAEEASHIFFCNGIDDDRTRLTSTHPPLDERIKRIQTMMGESFVPEPKPIDGRAAGEEPEEKLGGFVSRFLSAGSGPSESATTLPIEPGEAVANVGVPAARHLAYAAKLMAALPEPVRRAAREPRAATALIYVLLLSPVESVREAQLRLLKSRLSSEAALKINALSSALRDLNELIKIPLVELALPSLRQMSLPEYAAFRENTASLIATDQQVDLFEFALQKMLRRNLETKFKPVPEAETRHSTLAELGVAGSTVLSALAHAGQDTIKAAQAAFQRGVKHLEQIEAPFNFVALADCTLKSVDEGLDALAQSTTSLKKHFLRACSETVAADGRIRPREAELLRAISDSLYCPMPPLV